MRYRLMATYRGVPYEAGVGPADGNVVLFAACPPPEELGFEPATGHWRKQVQAQDVQALWESRPTGRFRGDRCMVLDDLGDRLHIAYLGHDAYRAEQLGYWEVDRGVFEVITPREEVTEIVEERVEFPRASSRGPAPHPSARVPAPALPASHPSGPLPVRPLPAGPLPAGPLPAGRLPLEEATRLAADPLPAGPLPLEEAARLAAAGPLPLEEAARLAAAARRQAPEPGGSPGGDPEPDWPEPDSRRSRRRDSARRRQATQQTFTELASQAAIPQSAFAVGEEVDGAMCLIQTADGFEVFNAAEGARHEMRLFDDEESAYFYLFGVLAAEAVRTGRLSPPGSAGR